MNDKDKAILSAVKAGVSAVPGVGGVVGSLIGDYIQDETDKALELAIRCLRRQLERLKERVSAETVNRAEFADLFKSAYLVIVRSHHEQKLRAASNVIANALLRVGDEEKLQFNDLDFFVRLIDRLSYASFSMLRLLCSEGGERHHITLEKIKSRLAGAPEALPEAALAELHSVGLVDQERASTAGPDGSWLSFKVSLLGGRFVRHVIDWGEKCPETSC